MGKEREQQIDRQLCTEIYQHQKTEKRKADIVELVKGEKKQRREITDHRHSDVGCVASRSNEKNVFLCHKNLLLYKENIKINKLSRLYHGKSLLSTAKENFSVQLTSWIFFILKSKMTKLN